MIEEIVVGSESEEDGKVNHYTITFIFKTGLQIKKAMRIRACIHIQQTTHVETIALMSRV